MKKILFPVDLEDSAYKQVVGYGLEIARVFRAPIIFLQIVPILPSFYNHPVIVEELVDRLKIDSEQKMGQFLEGISIPDVEITGKIIAGDPAEEILNFSQKEKIDLVIMGTHGRERVEKFFMGSVADKVVRSSPVPVITIRP